MLSISNSGYQNYKEECRMNIIDKWNALGDKVVGAEVELILKPIGRTLKDAAIYIGHTLTDFMPEIGAGMVVVCAVGIMMTGNVPKWLARMAVGLGAAIIWLVNA
jgi:hypothetical protein